MSRLTDKNRLSIVRPDLVKEWDVKKNGILTPVDVSCGSSKNIWWKCSKDHNYESKPSTRVRGRGCPYCAGKKVVLKTSIVTTHPDLADQWDYEKNDIMPSEISYGSNKKYWWKCKNGHSISNSPHSRHLGRGCSICSNKKVIQENSIVTTHLDLAKEWDYSKNNVSPLTISMGNNKKFWWVCAKSHSWSATPNHRSNGKGCPYCSGNKVCKETSLEYAYPDIVKEWDCSKNGQLSSFIHSGSESKVWWKCKKGHSWKTSVINRTMKNTGCPYCKNKKVCSGNSLFDTHPDLAKEWDNGKNKITSMDVTFGSGAGVWWKCRKGHSWFCTVSNRTNAGSGCPTCAKSQVELEDGSVCGSYAEAYMYLKYKEEGIPFLHNKRYGKKMGKRRYDFYFPSVNKFTEVTGYNKYWRYWRRYLRGIVVKKRYAKSIGASFEFIKVRINSEKKDLINSHLKS